MNNFTKILVCAALLGSAVFTSCEKNGLDFRKGEAIRFSAVSTGALSTKTSYGAVANGYQVIDWKGNDTIRVYSDNAVHRYAPDQKWADYYITGSTEGTKDGRPTRIATLAAGTLHNSAADNDNESANGLVWGEAESYTFWSVYPSVGQNPLINIADGGAITATLPASTPYSGTNTKTADGISYTEYLPNMNYAYMTSVATVDGNQGAVNLDFYPAFTAFEISLTEAADETEAISVTGVSLTAAANADFLAGTFTMTAGDLSTVAAASSASKTVSVSPNTTELTPAKALTVTLFAIPKTNSGLITLSIATTDGTANMPLYAAKNSTSPYQFEAGKKYRISLLKVGGKWQYKITLAADDDDNIEWELLEKETNFMQHIAAKAFQIEGHTETGNNYYPSATVRTYNIRTLDMDVTNPHFEVRFTPQAPRGGYWMLTPVSEAGMGTSAFRIVVVEIDGETESEDLRGQIMDKEIVLRIYPTVTADQRTEDHAISFKGFFSNSINFDENSTFSADSEIQDAHGDGTFSYWRFVIPEKIN